MKNKPAYIVSGCLAGLKCRYDGKSRPCAAIVKLYEREEALPVCPETLSGMTAPRPPCERQGSGFIDAAGRDMTEYFLRGAEKALQIALKSGCKKAILKSRSPSCGLGQIYDGSFSRQLCAGNGIFAQKLLDAGFEVFTEENLPPEINQKK